MGCKSGEEGEEGKNGAVLGQTVQAHLTPVGPHLILARSQ